MSRHVETDDDWQNDDDEDNTIDCPYCRASVYADTPRCPKCGNYISREDSQPARKPWWILLGAAAALFAVYQWIIR